MGSYYKRPVTTEYETRGCRVKIDAASCKDRVDISVENIKTGAHGTFSHVLMPGRNDEGYTDIDMQSMKDGLNELLDRFGETEWKEIHFTNQILM